MSNRKERLAVLAAALAFDQIGEPPAPYHPVVWYGKLIRRLENTAPPGKAAQLFYGAAMLVTATPCGVLPALGLHKLVRWGQDSERHTGPVRLAATLSEGALLKPFFALRMLVRAGQDVRLRLEEQDLPGAREALKSLVSRDRSGLSAGLVAAAAVESLAENLSDSVVAPLFYYTLLGLPGAAAYRLYNTFDSMIGYRGKYEYLGKAAARLDDLLNLIPARLTALLIIGLAPFYGGDMKCAWRTWRTDAGKTASPNAGHPMAAAAGALRVQLEKTGHYSLGQPLEPITPVVMKKAERMVWLVGFCAAGLVVLGGGRSRKCKTNGK